MIAALGGPKNLQRLWGEVAQGTLAGATPPVKRLLLSRLKTYCSCCHELGKLLRLGGKSLHLRLRIPALNIEHLRNVFRFCQIAGQGKGGICIPLGEFGGSILGVTQARSHLIGRRHFCPHG